MNSPEIITHKKSPHEYRGYIEVASAKGLLNTCTIKGHLGPGDRIAYDDMITVIFRYPLRVAQREREIEILPGIHSEEKIYRMILSIRIPQRLREIRPITYGIRAKEIALKANLILKKPHAFLVFGRNMRTDEKVIRLFVSPDLSPNREFKEIKKYVKEHMSTPLVTQK